MKKLIIAATLCAAAAVPAMAQTSLSISVGQPNFYGHIDLGGYAPPPVVYAQPVIVERQAHYVGQPVYLRVPEGHRKHWDKHCRAYNACGQQVFFVQDGWYSNTYAPRYREQQRRVVVRDNRDDYRGRDDRGHDGRGHDDRGHDDRGHDDRGRDDRGHDDRGHDDRGHDNGHGKGHDKHGD